MDAGSEGRNKKRSFINQHINILKYERYIHE